MNIGFTRRGVNEDATPELDPRFGADGQVTPESLAWIRAAAERGHVISMANLGTAMLSAGDQAGALHWLTRAWEAGNVAAGFNLGASYSRAGDSNRAQVVWEQCAALGDADAMLCLVRQALECGKPESVERWVRAILAQGDAFPITAMGFVFAQYGHTPQAVRAYRRAVDLGDGDAMDYLADILKAQGAHDEAEALRQRAKTAGHML